MVDVQRWASFGGIEVPVNLVLLIDDNPAETAAVREILEQKNISVRVATDGGQAQASFSMYKPDFVILDLILPGESGFEICERLKAKDDSVPVLVLSAIDFDDSRELARRVGADGYLLKPVAGDALLKSVHEIAETVWERTHLDQHKSDGDRIRFLCLCGKKFKVSASHRGKSLTCPQCGEPLTVPKQSTAM